MALDEQPQEIAPVRFIDAEDSTREYGKLNLEFDESELEETTESEKIPGKEDLRVAFLPSPR